MVCGFHHNPLEAPAENRTLVSVIHVADRLVSDLVEQGFRLDITREELDIAPEVKDLLALNEEKLAAIKESLPEKLADADPMGSEG